MCAVCPEISFADAVFCLTGASHRYTRSEFEELIFSLGGKVAGGVSKKVDYLVVGADGNPCWAYACYGRKWRRPWISGRKGIRSSFFMKMTFMMRWRIDSHARR